VKIAWPSTQRNQLPSCLALLNSSNLFPVSIPVMSLGQTFNSLINSRFWEPHWTLTSPCNPMSKLYPVPAFIIFDLSNKFVHRWTMTWPAVASALVSSRLDHLNSILHGAASKHINRLQRIQKALARTVMHQRSCGSPLSSTALLQDLHWLPIEWRVRFKLATLAYKALHTGQPPYLAELLRRNEPVRTLRSSASLLLSVPRCNLVFGSRAFQISAPNIWNSLPANIRDSPSLPTFRRHLKTHYFQLAYLSP